MTWHLRHTLTTTIHLVAYRAFQGKLLAARKAAGLTQAELADKLGKPQSFVSKAEAGDRRLDVVEYLNLVRHLGLQPSTLLDELNADLERARDKASSGKVWRR